MKYASKKRTEKNKALTATGMDVGELAKSLADFMAEQAAPKPEVTQSEAPLDPVTQLTTMLNALTKGGGKGSKGGGKGPCWICGKGGHIAANCKGHVKGSGKSSGKWDTNKGFKGGKDGFKGSSNVRRCYV